ncbi:MAG: ABC transporter ATP-binding protein [Spirochaetia bacterium]|nr:ABC transporter ATP-binding protein [Spirochaetia bacterium]
MALLTLENVSKIYSIEGLPVMALDSVTLSIEYGSFVSVIGKSGAGKTTLLRIINQLEKPDKGTISYDRSVKTGTIFQEPRLIRTKTVEKNLQLALCREKNREEVKNLIDETLRMTGLTLFRKAYPFQLSGGMAQRVSLGRALCRKPELLLMDEPFGALDAITRKNLQGELRTIFRSSNITIIFITHDVTEAIMLSERILVMNNGQITDDIKVTLPKDRNENDKDFIELKKHLYESIILKENKIP